MNRTEIKQHAQDELLMAMGLAFVRLSDDINLTTDERAEVREEMSKQMARIEKFFGHEPYSFMRGC